MSSFQQGIEARSLISAFRAGDALIGEDLDDGPARSGGDFVEGLKLVLDRLLVSAATAIDRGSLHL